MKISGEITKPEYSHTIMGEKFYSSTIRSVRASGTTDNIPLIISEVLLPCPDKVLITGEIRTRNSDKHLQQYIFVDSIEPWTMPHDINDVELSGTICSICKPRRTPRGRVITNIILAAHRRYNKSDYIPCVLWGMNIPLLTIGDEVTLNGRYQSRTYGEDKETYELSVSKVVK